MGKLLLFLVPLVLTIFCVVDAITSREDDVRHIPKLWWILLILFFPVVGAVAWLLAGRPVAQPAAPRPRPAAPRSPRAEADFQRRLRERAEEQRRKAAEQEKGEEGDYPSPGE